MPWLTHFYALALVVPASYEPGHTQRLCVPLLSYFANAGVAAVPGLHLILWRTAPHFRFYATRAPMCPHLCMPNIQALVLDARGLGEGGVEACPNGRREACVCTVGRKADSASVCPSHFSV